MNNRRLGVLGLALILVAALAIPALSLWGDFGAAQTPAFPLGKVAFGVAPAADLATFDLATFDLEAAEFTMSPDGSPVSFAIPGEVIAQVANQNLADPTCATTAPPCDPSPTLWAFVVAGRAPSSVGLQYTMAVVGQAGNPIGQTLLDTATVAIYPAGADPLNPGVPQCDTVTMGTAGVLPNVYLDSPAGNYVISQAGTPDAAANPQVWCVAITQNGELAEPPESYYVNTFTATAVGLDGTPVSDSETWWAQLVSDPSAEPDLLLAIDPVVTHVSPAYPTPSDTGPTS